MVYFPEFSDACIAFSDAGFFNLDGRIRRRIPAGLLDIGTLADLQISARSSLLPWWPEAC